MRVLYDHASPTVPVHEVTVSPDTVIRSGQLLVSEEGRAVPAEQDVTGPVLGIALETHTGKAQRDNPRANGTRCRAADGPQTVLACPPPELTATAGTQTSITDENLAGFDDGALAGYTLVLEEKGTGSGNPDPAGTEYRVTDYDTTTKTLTVEGAGGTIGAGDRFAAYPPPGRLTGLLNAARDALTLEDGAAPVLLPLRVLECDPVRRELRLYPELHEFAVQRG